MNGEPFCYDSRLTVRQLVEERRNGYGLGRILTDRPELKALRVATAWAHAAGHRGRYAELVGPDGSLVGPGSRPRRPRSCPNTSGSRAWS